MRLIETIDELQSELGAYRKMGKTIGFVPTMGYLHEGHISLVKASKKDNDITVMSIFVNPTQFGPNEDFESYPRDLSGDSKKAEEGGADLIFAPSVQEMYPSGYNTFIDVYGITDKMCGKLRPGHFRGVCTVVAKLFNIVRPDRAYFGQKDAQQVAVIRRMNKDLNMGIEIISCPIIREEDGLAKSSRNVYLNADERKAALILSRTLARATDIIKGGETDISRIKTIMEEDISKEKLAKIDYVEISQADTLEEVSSAAGTLLVALAVKIGNTRLIDNVIVEV
jgi:pantoate--beta-alanine ligase